MAVCCSIKMFYTHHCFVILVSTNRPVLYKTVIRYVTFGASISKQRNVVHKIEEVHALKTNGEVEEV
jgi:hypothetical protein